MPVLVDDAGLVQPQELEIGIPGHTQRGPQPKQQHAAAVVQQLCALLHRVGCQQTLGIGQGLDILLGHLLDDLVDAVPGGQLLLGVAACLSQGGQFSHQSTAQLLVSLKAHRPADPHHAGRGREGPLGQLPDREQGGFLGI